MTEQTVRAPAGNLTGTVRNGVWKCHSIPYATATRFAPSVPAAPGDHDGRAPSEADMVVTVCAPAEFPGNAPTLLWLHGGRYEEGSASEPWSNGRHLAEEGVVTVNFGYRKRFEGFWRDSPEDTFTAVADLRHAVTWVLDNAEALGIDTTNMTLGGQSAGAGLALTLAADPQVHDHIARVIALSPGFSRAGTSARRRAVVRTLTRTSPTRSSIAAMSPENEQTLYRRTRSFFPTDTCVGPGISNAVQDLPMLVTTTSEEFHFMDILQKADASKFGRLAARALAPIHGASVKIPDDPRPLARLISDATIRNWAVKAADAAVAAGTPVWAGEFYPGQGLGVGPDGELTSGAPHCIDIPRLFGREAHPFHREVLGFITDGTLPWPTYDTGKAQAWFGAGEFATEETIDDPWAEVREQF